MISKNAAKYIKSLQQKKSRIVEKSFIVEGSKSVIELIKSDFKIRTVYVTSVFLKEQKQLIYRNENKFEIIEAHENELSAVGSYTSNNAAIAIAEMKENVDLSMTGFSIALDRVNDPGNVGTIIRIADWYGIKNILCSPDCADQYNPKVIAASMGSFTRVNLFYTDLKETFRKFSLPVYGAYLEGENVHRQKFEKEGILLMGSESQGIRSELEQFVNYKINIPSFGHAESLNVGVATAIICDNIRRVGVQQYTND